MKKTLTTLLSILLAGCANLPPTHQANVCSIFHEKDGWYEAAAKTSQRWGTPIALQMAIIRQESAFVEDARPPRDYFLGIIPLGRPSTAYGYCQALDGTWARYQQSTRNLSGERDDFADATDFIGWYLRQNRAELGIARTDAYRHYLAYHEGQAGYQARTWLQKPALMETAREVARNTSRYERQLASCQPELDQAIDID